MRRSPVLLSLLQYCWRMLPAKAKGIVWSLFQRLESLRRIARGLFRASPYPSKEAASPKADRANSREDSGGGGHLIFASRAPDSARRVHLESADSDLGVVRLPILAVPDASVSQADLWAQAAAAQPGFFPPAADPPTPGWLVETPRDAPPPGYIVEPMFPEQIPRYRERMSAPREFGRYIIETGPSNFFSRTQHRDAGDWTGHEHPDGALYFHARHRMEHVPYFTDLDMTDHIERQQVEKCVVYLESKRRAGHPRLPRTHGLQLCIGSKSNGDIARIFTYYYVAHVNHTIFWLQDYDPKEMVTGVQGVAQLSHMHLRLKSQYWSHISLYPISLTLDATTYKRSVDVLVHGCIDAMTSRSTILPLSADDMQGMLRLLADAKKSGCFSDRVDDSFRRDHLVCAVANIRAFFAQWQFLNFYGQADVGGLEHFRHRRSILLRVFSPLLFYLPDVHMHGMTKIEDAPMMLARLWQDFALRLQSEWQEFTLYATVILAANVGFLAIPGVGPESSNTSLTAARATQIASYMSMLISIGSIITGLMLLRHIRTKVTASRYGASEYLTRNTHRYFGLEPLAIILSIPYALLMWAMVAFLAGLLALCFGTPDLRVQLPIALCTAAVASLILWCALLGWDIGQGGRRLRHAGSRVPWTQVFKLSRDRVSRKGAAVISRV